jgi:hypothetical protein
METNSLLYQTLNMIIKMHILIVILYIIGTIGRVGILKYYPTFLGFLGIIWVLFPMYQPVLSLILNKQEDEK